MSDKPFCILAIDGGGTRASIAALMLASLEKKLQQFDKEKRLKDYFDLIAGSSSGSAIACAIAKGIEASAILQFYLSHTLGMFPPFGNTLFGIFRFFSPGYSQPIYDGTGLETALQEENFLGKWLLFGELEKPTIITSYDPYNRQAVIFKNTRVECEKIPVWEICRAATAFPVAFPGYSFKHQPFLTYLEEREGKNIPTDEQGKKYLPLIDGGAAFNNPALFALAERMNWNSEPPTHPKWQISRGINLENILLASFGTGHSVNSVDARKIKEWGLAEWVSPAKGIPLVDTFAPGCADAIADASRHFLKSDRYFRFQPKLPEDFPSFRTSQKKLEKLLDIGEKFLQTEEIEGELQNLTRILLSNSQVEALAR